ncbi:MAG: hypothetical protein KBD51_02510 [Candidatus Levybacteria bacterium]|nr:hypothetical protein [Candidatus Levybacteria bacterium]
MKDGGQIKPELPMPTDAVKISFDGNPLILRPGIIKAPVGAPLELRFSDVANDTTRAYLVKTPISDYESVFDAILRRDGEAIDLGEIPSMLSSGNTDLEVQTEEDTVYDIFLTHNEQVSFARIVTGDEVGVITFDELKLLVSIYTQIPPDELAGIKGRVIADELSVINRQDLAYFGIQVDDLVATISTRTPFKLLFVDKTGFRRDLSRDDFRSHLLQKDKIKRVN